MKRLHVPGQLEVIPDTVVNHPNFGAVTVHTLDPNMPRSESNEIVREIIHLGCDAWVGSPWVTRELTANGIEPTPENRTKAVRGYYDSINVEHGNRIRSQLNGSRLGNLALTSLVSTQNDGVVGFIQPRLEASGEPIEALLKRVSYPEKVYPSMGGGVVTTLGGSVLANTIHYAGMRHALRQFGDQSGQAYRPRSVFVCSVGSNRELILLLQGLGGINDNSHNPKSRIQCLTGKMGIKPTEEVRYIFDRVALEEELSTRIARLGQ